MQAPFCDAAVVDPPVMELHCTETGGGNRYFNKVVIYSTKDGSAPQQRWQYIGNSTK
jgi:hypothetical protein